MLALLVAIPSFLEPLEPCSARSVMRTRWAAEVDPSAPLPEYPRPMLERERWQSLNGPWSYQVTPIAVERATEWIHPIIVPFPIESALSTVEQALAPDEALHYQREFTIPQEWRGQRVRLNFGAVDWSCTVRVNGQVVGNHEGGWTAFSFDITPFLKADEYQELEVRVTDPTDSGPQPRGKQVLEPQGIFYTRVSGIWQSVWIEPVADVSLEQVLVTSRSDLAGFTITPFVRGVEPGVAPPRVRAELHDAQGLVASIEGPAGSRFELRPPTDRLRRWTPDDPHLYELRTSILASGRVLDHARTPVGLRTVRVASLDGGPPRILLNDKALFQFGPLDQGFWPDGLYTAPTDEALRHDVQIVKRMGGNMLRKHVKVEPERFYAWCDRLGVLVWQDMPSGSNDEAFRPAFERELRAMVEQLRVHPSIVMWVPFNEGWGQYDTQRVTDLVKELDPSRLVNNASGWTDAGAGHVMDIHAYPGPACPPTEVSRAAVLGEFGGLGFPVPGHLWKSDGNWGYVSYATQEELTEAYVSLLTHLRDLIALGLSAAVYTQTTDVETEINGWLTYDRQVLKIDEARAHAAGKALADAPIITRTIAATAQLRAEKWRWTTTTPGEKWMAPGFDDRSWNEGEGGFGRAGTPGAVIGTAWETDEIWIRKRITLSPGARPTHLLMHHDEDAIVFIDGRKVAELPGYTTSYVLVPLPADLHLERGEHVLAVHCRQTRGGQYIDAGLVAMEKASP